MRRIDRRDAIRAALAAPLSAGIGFAAGPAAAQEASRDVDAAIRALLGLQASIFGFANTEQQIEEAPTLDYAPSLIFAMRYAGRGRVEIQSALSRLTGETDRLDWFDWMLWQEAHPEVSPRPAYRDLKRDMFLRVDPEFARFLGDDALDAAQIRFEEVTWGGVRVDGIPSLDQPNMIAADDADYLLDDDLVFGVEINGDVRAYPLRIMGWHEMFNDVVGGVPVALAYCTLCGAGILFETARDGGDPAFVFGSSGFLYRSNKLMFDRETSTLWNQFTGEPVIGPLVDSGVALAQRPVVITPWARWRDANPGTTVLSLNTGHVRDYGSGVVYQEYFASPDLMFPTLVDETDLRRKDYVFGVRTAGGAKAWPLEAFEGGRIINDSVGLLNVVLVGEADGRTVRAFDRGDRIFEADGAGGLRDADGGVWAIEEAALIGPDGARAPRVAGHVAFWFAWDGYLGTRSELYAE